MAASALAFVQPQPFRSEAFNPCQAQPAPPSENRVVGLGEGEVVFLAFVPAHLTETHQDTWVVGTTTASGISFFLSKDPIGISGGLNQYVFCKNSPVNYIDPLGLYTYDTSNMGMAFLHEVNPFNADGAFWRGSAAYVDGMIPFIDPLAKAGAYDANDKAYQGSQIVGSVTRDALLIIGGGGVGSAARTGGQSLNAGQRIILGEFGPSTVGLLMSGGNVTTRGLVIGYGIKTVGRIDTILNIRDIMNDDDPLFPGGNPYDDDSCAK